MSGIKLYGSTRFFDIFCAIDMIIYLAPKRSTETNISKISSFHNERRLWPIFPCIIACFKPQGRPYKCVQAIATITLELFRAFFKDLRGC